MVLGGGHLAPDYLVGTATAWILMAMCEDASSRGGRAAIAGAAFSILGVAMSLAMTRRARLTGFSIVHAIRARIA